MKALFVVFVIYMTVASAQLTAVFSYRGATNCTDVTKLANVRVTNFGDCVEEACKYESISQYWVTTRCYYDFAEAPVPSDVITVLQYASTDCNSEIDTYYFQRLGLLGCAVVDGQSGYYPDCNTVAACNSTDCTACTTAEVVEGQCVTTVGAQAFCGRNSTILPIIPAPPLVGPTAVPSAPISAPVSAPKSVPTGTPAPSTKKSSGIVHVPVISAVAFVVISLIAVIG